MGSRSRRRRSATTPRRTAYGSLGILSDEGQSGTNGLDARVGLAEALATVERGEVAAIVVARMDRLARDLQKQETLMARMRQAGAEVISVSEPDMDSDDPTRVPVPQVLGSISQFREGSH